MEEAGLHEVVTYSTRFQNILAQYIATMPIMDLCLAAEIRPGKRVYKWWWGQKELYLEWMRTEARKTER